MSCCFFFSSRRRHTRFDCDWSSDVCSSDLRLEGKLHHRATDGVVLVVHAINCDIDVAAVLAVNGKNRVAVLGWIVRVCRLHTWRQVRSEEHTSELQSQSNLVCRLLLEKKKIT